MSGRPSIGIVTVSYQDCDGLRRTLESVIAQADQPDVVIVADGGSTDGSVAYLESLDFDFLSWTSARDEGIFDGQNRGLFQLTTDYVLFLNSGDILARPDAVSILRQASSRSPLWVLAGAIDLQGRGGPEEFRHVPPRWVRHALGKQYYCQQSCLYRVDLLQILGGLDWRLAGDGADFDLNMRLGLLASPTVVSSVVVAYEGGGMSAQRDYAVHLPLLKHRIRSARMQFGPVLGGLSRLWGEYRSARRRVRYAWNRLP